MRWHTPAQSNLLPSHFFARRVRNGSSEEPGRENCLPEDTENPGFYYERYCCIVPGISPEERR